MTIANLKTIFDLEAAKIIDVSYRIEYTHNTTTTYTLHHAVAGISGGNSSYKLIFEVLYRAPHLMTANIDFFLSKDQAVYFMNNWPTTLEQLMTILLLAGAVDVWHSLEDEILSEAKQYLHVSKYIKEQHV